MSCLVTCTYKTNRPAATDAFANTYLFVVTVRHCVFLLPFYMVALCGVTGYISVAVFFKLTNTVHFSVFLSSAIICNIVMTYATNL